MYKSNKNIFVAIIAALSMGVTSGGALAGGFLNVEFVSANFSAPQTIDNPYWPLNPDDGSTSRTFTYIGETEDECVIIQISVNGDTYALTGEDPYYGLVALQVLDTEWVFEDVEECDLSLLGELEANEAIEEQTLDWYMQDNWQNIWYVGEHSQIFEDLSGEGGPDCSSFGFPDFGAPPECTEGSWEAGKWRGPDGPAPDEGDEEDERVLGEAGIVVPSDFPLGELVGEPLENGAYYMQEVAFEAEDMAKILRQHASLSVEDGVEPGEYENCRKAKEWTALEPGESVEHKWYCPGPGLVLIEGIGGGPTEVEVLTEVEESFLP